MTRNPLFILAGNGPYENRGCEAIVRGTAKILRKHFKNPYMSSFYYALPEYEYSNQFLDEFDPEIIHKPIYTHTKPFSVEMVRRGLLHILKSNSKNYRPFRNMLSEINDSEAVLSVGGDNYSLDYGIPKKFTNLDDLVQAKKKPLVIWGASVGPFDSLPEYKPFIINHLQNVTAIFSRESATTEYLRSNGIFSNVYEVADPAYLLTPAKPKKPKAIDIEEESIGINLSPLMAKYVCNGDMQLWEKIAATIISSISNTTGKKVYLIPHVTIPDSNDFLFMKNALSHLPSNDDIILLDPIYNAAETKWIISKLSFFAGARMHSTIAALSSGVPTLSFAYSIKSKGINKDLFGHDSYCLSPENLNEKLVTKKINSMLSDEMQIAESLEQKVPLMKERAMDAGSYLQELLD